MESLNQRTTNIYGVLVIMPKRNNNPEIAEGPLEELHKDIYSTSVSLPNFNQLINHTPFSHKSCSIFKSDPVLGETNDLKIPPSLCVTNPDVRSPGNSASTLSQTFSSENNLSKGILKIGQRSRFSKSRDFASQDLTIKESSEDLL